MKIKLLNGAEYKVTDVCNKGETVEIVLCTGELTAEETEEKFKNKENLKRIEVYEKTLLTTILDYVVLSEVKLKDSVVTIILTKEIDVTEQRITDAHAAAVEANETAKEAEKVAFEASATNEQIIANIDYLAMELGVEV